MHTFTVHVDAQCCPSQIQHLGDGQRDVLCPPPQMTQGGYRWAWAGGSTGCCGGVGLEGSGVS